MLLLEVPVVLEVVDTAELLEVVEVLTDEEVLCEDELVVLVPCGWLELVAVVVAEELLCEVLLLLCWELLVVPTQEVPEDELELDVFEAVVLGSVLAMKSRSPVMHATYLG